MAGNLKLEVVTPEGAVVSDEAKMVVAPGTLGEFGVLPGHTTFMTTLKVGALRYTDETGKERYVFVSGGFAEALPSKVTVLAESAERRREIDVERAMAAKKRAEQRLEQARNKPDIDYVRAKAALERALQRIRISESAQG